MGKSRAGTLFICLCVFLPFSMPAGAQMPKKSINAEGFPDFPAYPGSVMVYEENKDDPGQIWGVREYLTKDSLEKTVEFFDRRLERAGWTVTGEEATREARHTFSMFRPAGDVLERGYIEVAPDDEYPDANRIWFERAEEPFDNDFSGMIDELNRNGRVVLEGIYFPFDSPVLLAGSRPAIVALAEYLQLNLGSRIELDGYTDARGSRERNLKVSLLRAEALKKALVSRGVEKDRIEVKGLGPGNPVADNGTAAGRARNRRIEVVILPEQRENREQGE
jgi:outer membrane protein OmpA-like peptidoglycan-associated protein